MTFSSTGGLKGFIIFMVVSGLLLCFSLSSAIAGVNFSNTSGYGISTSRVMVSNIKVDYEVYNPMAPMYPTLVTSYWNVPFNFDGYTAHLVPDLNSAVLVSTSSSGGGSSCASFGAYINDAYNGQSISGAYVEIGGQSAYANSSGYASFSGLPAGSAQLTAAANGYVTSSRQVDLACDGSTNSVGMALSPTSGGGAISDGQVRVILSWGANPSDLDSHLTGPDVGHSGNPQDESNRFHLYYSSRTDGGLGELDVDDTSSYGPETVTFSPSRAGVYRYSVHHYAGSSTISSSNASVTLLVGNTTIATYSPPAGASGSKDVWTVFEILIGSNGSAQLYDVNTISNQPSSGSVRSTSTGYGSVETGVDFTRLPGK
ncbi:MAG: carboxypeptidase regulatory-like domain-containing protein [Desulfuromonadales bacterium]|nr:carboxypeptidase regulatory-like domain-containing protein [Desulfuromonadales bacterium]